jgi:histidine ammonia-lyase
MSISKSRSEQAEPFRIGLDVLDFQSMRQICREGREVVLSDAAKQRIERSRSVVDQLIAGEAMPRRVSYGINTGFGFLADVRISATQIVELQYNLVRSHAAGVGPLLPIPVVRGMLLLRACTLSLGHSGVRLASSQSACVSCSISASRPACQVVARSVRREIWPRWRI